MVPKWMIVFAAAFAMYFVSGTEELKAEKYVLVVHRDNLNVKSYSVMSLTDYIALTKTIKLEGRLLAEAQKRSEAQWSGGGRYPGRVLGVRSAKRQVSFMKQEAADKKLQTVLFREKEDLKEAQRKLEHKLGREEYQRLMEAKRLLDSNLSALVSEYLNREKVGPVDL